MDMNIDIDKLYSTLQPKFGFNLKNEQKKIISAIIKKKDVSAVLPTGYGKSMCYVLPPLMQDMIESSIKHVAIVVSPLISLMKDQIDNLNIIGIRSLMLTHENKLSLEEISQSDISIVFTTPESLQTNFTRRLFMRKDFQVRICLLACDEAHCVSDWGEDFRPDFRQVSTFRSLLDVPVLALTATATQSVQKDIYRYLLLDEDALAVAVIPDRKNIFISIEKSSQDFETELKWLLEGCRSSTDWKKVIIFCRSYTIVYELWSWLVDSLGNSAFLGERHFSKRKIEMFHSGTDEISKDRILSNFKTENSCIRILVTTVAFGMGISIPDIDLVIHWGSAKSVLSYWQEIGRAGRSAKPASAVMYAYPRSLMKTITADKMSEIVNSRHSSCLRRTVLSELLTSSMKVEDLPRATASCSRECCTCNCALCFCCSYCASLCECTGKLLPSARLFI